MPTYDYVCSKCKNSFSTTLTISEYEKRKAKCPKCGSTSLKQQISHFMVKTSRKS